MHLLLKTDNMLFKEAHKEGIESYISFHKMQGTKSFHYNVYFPKSWPEDIIKAGQDLIKSYLESEKLSYSEFMPIGERADQMMQEIFISWSKADTKKAIKAGYNMTFF
jgi:hypothetical protein